MRDKCNTDGDIAIHERSEGAYDADCQVSVCADAPTLRRGGRKPRHKRGAVHRIARVQAHRRHRREHGKEERRYKRYKPVEIDLLYGKAGIELLYYAVNYDRAETYGKHYAEQHYRHEVILQTVAAF